MRKVFLTIKSIVQKIYQLSPFSKNQLIFAHLPLFILWLVCLIILLNYLWPKNKLEQTKIALAHWPLSAEQHLKMSQVFFETGDLDKTKTELNQAKYLYQLTQWLDWGGKLKIRLDKQEKFINQPAEIKKQINYWEEIINDKPNFRDAYLYLTFLYYQNWQEKEAQEAWQKAFYLDPNNQIVQDLGKLINQTE